MQLTHDFSKISRSEVFVLIAKCRAENASQRQLADYLYDIGATTSLGSANKEVIEKAVLETVQFEYKDSTNGFLAQINEALTGVRCEVTGSIEKLYNCRCCGAATLSEISSSFETASYEICPCCGWEDVGPQKSDVHISINRGSMQEYREKLTKLENSIILDRWFFPEGKLF